MHWLNYVHSVFCIYYFFLFAQVNINPLYRTSELHYALEKVGISYLVKQIVTPLNSDWQISELKIVIILSISYNMWFASATIKL